MSEGTPKPKPPKRPVGPIRSQHESARRGLILAAIIGLALAAGLGALLLTSGGARGPQARTTPPVSPPSAAAPSSDSGEVMALENVRIDLLDRDDPARVAGRLEFAAMDPLEGRNYDVQQPDGWIYPARGGAIRIRATRGRLYMPERAQAPESGALHGEVTIDYYQTAGPVATTPDQPPTATLRTASLSFDTVVGSLSTPDRVTIASPQLDFAGSGLNVLFSRAAQRLELLEIARGEEIRFRPGADRKSEPTGTSLPATAVATTTAATKTSADRSATPGTPATTNPAALPADANHYRVVLRDEVALLESTRRLDADRLTLFARLIDNQLPPGAIAPVRFAPVRYTPAPRAPLAAADTGMPWRAPMLDDDASAMELGPVARSTPVAGMQAPEPIQAQTSAELQDVVLRWTGPLVATRLEERPEELARDDLAGRFDSPDRGEVTLVDPDRGFTGRAGAIAYAATTRRLTLDGRAAAPAELVAQGTGSVVAPRIEADLAAGLIRMPGPVKLTGIATEASAAATSPAPAGSLSASQQIDLMLETTGDTLVQALRQAVLTGDVVATSDAGELRAGFVRADFVPGGQSSLARLIAEEAVQASTRDGVLRAGRLDVAFTPDSTRPRPSVLTAERDVTLERGQDRLGAQFLEAGLEATDRGGTAVTRGRLRGEVRYENTAERLIASANELRADLAADPSVASGRRQVVDLAGTVTLQRLPDTTIRGEQIRLDGAGPSIEVFGAGSFAHQPEPGATQPAVQATWTDGMTFDDATGRLECRGSTEVRAASSPDERDRLAADRIVALLTPRAAAVAQDAPRPSESSRQLLSAEAYGSGETPGRARVEARRYAPGTLASDAPRLDQLLFIEGDRLLLDAAAGTLDIPTAGRLVVRDIRDRAEPGTSGSAGASPDARGDALVDWDGSLTFNRTTGAIELARAVRLTHRRVQDGVVTTIRSDRLSGMVARGRDDPASPWRGGGTLTAVKAAGSVYALSGREGGPTRELSADLVDYDTARGVLAARADPGRTVTMLDAGRATTFGASSIFWNLVEDRISIESPQPVTVPR